MSKRKHSIVEKQPSQTPASKLELIDNASQNQTKKVIIHNFEWHRIVYAVGFLIITLSAAIQVFI